MSPTPAPDDFLRLADRYFSIEVGGRAVLVDDELAEIDDAGAGSALVLALLARLREGAGRAELEAMGGPAATELLAALGDAGCLRRESLRLPERPWQRQVLFLDDLVADAVGAQSRLERARVLVVGVGGIGAVVADHLVRSGVGALVLVDGDEVAVDNLNRQTLFDAADVGRPKVEAARQALLAIDAAVRIEAVASFVESVADVVATCRGDGVDLIVNAADRPVGIRGTIGDAAVALDAPLITSGLGRHVGSWGPLAVPRRTPCLRCFDRRRLDAVDELTRGAATALDGIPPAASFGPHNTVIAALAARDATLAMAVGFDHAASFGTACHLDFRTMEIRRREFGGPCECWRKPS